MKKTALLRLGHIEMMDGQLDQLNICIKMISTSIYICRNRNQFNFYIQIMTVLFMTPLQKDEIVVTAELNDFWNNWCLHPTLFFFFFKSHLTAIICAMHARRLREIN